MGSEKVEAVEVHHLGPGGREVADERRPGVVAGVDLLGERLAADELGLGPEFLGSVRLAGSVASLAGVACYNLFLKKMRLRTVFAGAAVAGALLSSTQLLLVTGASRAAGIPDGAFVLADAAVLSALGQAAFLPVLVLAARLCPPGVEATLYAALMSLSNAGGGVGEEEKN